MRHISPFLIATQFLTRVPLPTIEAPTPEEAGRSVLAYPALGLMLGGVLALAAAVPPAHVPPYLTAALLVALWAAATGGLHLDGLADSADAWACGGDAERRLAVMKDPNCGPAAVVALVAMFFVKFASLTALVTAEHWLAVALAPALGRTAPLALFLTAPYVRAGGLGSAMAAHLPRAAGWVVIALTAAGAVAAGCAAMWLAATVTLILLRHLMMHHLGGATGDTIGASVELSETAALTAAVFAG